ncbi:MAG: PsiF family protein [Sphingomonadaceae bacterium]
MKKLITALFLSLAASSLALAQPQTQPAPKKEPTAAQKKQQDRMRECNAQAGEKKLSGEPRKQFMSSCLSGEGPKGKSSQQDKMKACNKEASAKKLKGDAHKKFMSECLKG